MGTLSAVRPKLFLLCCALQRGEETPLWCGNVAHAPERSNLHRRVLSTNAIKDTVSVLYWYGELSSFDWQFLGRIFGSFFLCPNFARRCVTLCQSRCQCVGGCVLCFRCLWCGVCVWLGWGGGVPLGITNGPETGRCVRPYLAESTTSRPICEVKQPQA